MPKSVLVIAGIVLVCLGIGVREIWANAQGQVAHCDNPWVALTKEDIGAAYQIILKNHPGPLDKNNPRFQRWLHKGRELALSKAEKAANFAGYYFTMRYYINGFNDPHLNYGSKLEIKSVRWPGFVVALRGSNYVIHSANGDPTDFPELPKKGYILISCDGQTPEEMLQTNIFPYFGNDHLAAYWITETPRLFIDYGNPFAEIPRKCLFEFNGKTKELALEWKLVRKDNIERDLIRAGFGHKPRLGISKFGPDAYWVSLPSFWVSGADRAKMKETVDRLKNLRKADILVLDVRGNDGGSSQWGYDVLKNLYGRKYERFIESRFDSRVDWRASPRNIEIMRKVLPYLRKNFGKNSQSYQEAKSSVDGMAQALRKKEAFYHEPHSQREKIEPVAKPLEGPKKIFLVTDGHCVSACLDFADIMLSVPGVVQAGLPTVADTDYNEVGNYDLPSGIGSLYSAMKVYRDIRPRKPGQAYTPKHIWNGNIWNTQALKKWILNLVDGISPSTRKRDKGSKIPTRSQ